MIISPIVPSDLYSCKPFITVTSRLRLVADIKRMKQLKSCSPVLMHVGVLNYLAVFIFWFFSSDKSPNSQSLACRFHMQGAKLPKCKSCNCGRGEVIWKGGIWIFLVKNHSNLNHLWLVRLTLLLKQLKRGLHNVHLACSSYPVATWMMSKSKPFFFLLGTDQDDRVRL